MERLVSIVFLVIFILFNLKLHLAADYESRVQEARLLVDRLANQMREERQSAEFEFFECDL